MIVSQVVGGPQVVQRLGRLGGTVNDALGDEVQRITLDLLRHVVSDKLSGQVLNVRSGRLRRSINQRVEGKGSEQVAGYVGTNVVYARPFELGFKGPETVKSHMRQMNQAFGKPVKNPRQIQVSAFTRHVDVKQRSFLASALEDMTPDIRLRLGAAVRKAVAR